MPHHSPKDPLKLNCRMMVVNIDEKEKIAREVTGIEEEEQ